MKKQHHLLLILFISIFLAGCASTKVPVTNKEKSFDYYYALTDYDCNFLIEVVNNSPENLTFTGCVINTKKLKKFSPVSCGEDITLAPGESKLFKFNAVHLLNDFDRSLNVAAYCYEKDWYWWWAISPGMINHCIKVLVDDSSDSNGGTMQEPNFFSYFPKDQKSFVEVFGEEEAQSKRSGLIANSNEVVESVFVLPQDVPVLEKGSKYINAYLQHTDYENVYEATSPYNAKLEKEFIDVYLYSKKEQKIVAVAKDCYRNTVWYGARGWGDIIKDAYSFYTKNKKWFLAERSDYYLLQLIDGQLWGMFPDDTKITASTKTIEALRRITFTAENVSNKYLLVCGCIKGSKYAWDSTLKVVEGGSDRTFEVLIPYGYDKLKIFGTNQENYISSRPVFEEKIVAKIEDGRSLKIPDSYAKAEYYKRNGGVAAARVIAEDAELDRLRETDTEAYLNEVVRRIDAFGLDDFGTVTAVHDFIANLVCYDFDGVYVYHTDVPADYPSVLRLRKTKCAGYANLFNEMCYRLGITCQIVDGYARGYGWDPKDNPKETNHSWNAVMLDDVWYLIDCTWDAGSETGGVREVRCNHTWLFVIPQEMIPSHFPKNPEWQMLSKPVTAGQFIKTASSNPWFYE